MRRQGGAAHRASALEERGIDREAGWSIGTVVVILYQQVSSMPTEAAGVAVVYSLFVTMVVHREVGLQELWRIIQSAVFLISQILMIVTAAGLVSATTTSGIPQQITGDINAMQLLPPCCPVDQSGAAGDGKLFEPPAAILILTSVPPW